MQGWGGCTPVAMWRVADCAEREEASGGQGRRPWTRSFSGGPFHPVTPDLIRDLAYSKLGLAGSTAPMASADCWYVD
jgi:hypothetical protein